MSRTKGGLPLFKSGLEELPSRKLAFMLSGTLPSCLYSGYSREE